MNISGTGKNGDISGKEGTKKEKTPHKKATKASQIKTHPKTRVTKPTKAIWIHC